MPQPATATTGHKWAITHQEEEATIDEKGNPSTIHTVHFKTNTGHESSITLPDSHFTPTNVAQQVEHKANHIIAVHQMNSTNAPKPE